MVTKLPTRIDNMNPWSIGATGDNVAYTEGSPLVSIYATNAGTGSTNAEPFLVESTLTGAGQVGGRSKFKLTANAAQGGWINAVKGETTFGASGSTSGLASVICGDLTLSAGTATGTYAVFEANISAATGDGTGTANYSPCFIQCNAAGTGADTVDGAANLFGFGAALDAASGKFIDTDITTHSGYGGIRIFIDGVGIKYLAVVSD